MIRTHKRQFSFLLCLVLIFCMSISASARASDYFYRTSVSATNPGNGVVRIKIDVGATGTMQELGATQVIVHEKNSNGDYEPIFTFTRENTPSLVTQNRASYITYVNYYGSPGKSYYILCAFYAKKSTGSQIIWGGSNIVNT